MRLPPLNKMMILGLAALGPSAAHAFDHTLTDGNSVVVIDDASQAGMSQWSVDGVNHVFQQWFWYRTGASGPEASIDTLPFLGAIESDTNFEVGVDALALRYGSLSGFEVQVKYFLTGGTDGSGQSDVSEAIRLVNHGTTPLDLHFFQYADFDMCGDGDNDTARLVFSNTVQQFDGACGSLSETVATPNPNASLIAFFPNILISLNDGSATNLGGGPTEVTGDVAWAYQWNFTIAPGGSALISKDKLIRTEVVVPEPGTLTLLGLGLGLLAARLGHKRL
jgi:PEP-CTERM motif